MGVRGAAPAALLAASLAALQAVLAHAGDGAAVTAGVRLQAAVALVELLGLRAAAKAAANPRTRGKHPRVTRPLGNQTRPTSLMSRTSSHRHGRDCGREHVMLCSSES